MAANTSEKEFSFFNELTHRVDQYFEKSGKNRWGDWRIHVKSIVLISALIAIYVTLVFFTPNGYISLLLCSILGFTLAGIGFNVMHDSAHGSYSRYPWLNNLMGHSLNIMGGDVHLWKTKHNMVHHNFTNVVGLDDDIDISPVMRISLQQEKKSFHKYQHIYAFFLYALNYLLWVFYFDFKKYFSGKIGVTKIKRYNFWQHVSFWATKVSYYALFIGLPIYKLGLLNTLIGYGVTIAVCGIVIAVVFQLAHVVEETTFYDDNKTRQKLDNDWAVQQINTTSNFAMHNKVVSWFTGGLNFQVEHHLFPRISHIHYPELSKIVQKMCRDYGVQYNYHRTVLQAVRSHVVHLKHVGRA
jgi:linoleoyl-CoA desaturase